MLRSYIKIAFRNLRRRKGYAFINIFGLAIGLAACILIGLWVQDELSYDRFHENAERTYRVLREFDMPELRTTITTTPSALAAALEENVPAVEEAVRIERRGPVVQHGTQKGVEQDFLWADPGFFEIFSFPMLRGEVALDRPGTVVLTETMAAKYFPGEDPIGQALRVGEEDLEVTGIMADVPHNSHLQFGFVGSLETHVPETNWGLNNYVTYVLLAEESTQREVTLQVAEVIAANTPSGGGGEGDSDFIPHLQPLAGIHLGQGVVADVPSQGNVLYVYLFGALAVFILLLACINFMNLATARSTERAREVGMRKALGADRSQLAVQFLGETVLMSLAALVLAILFCWAALPFVGQLAGKTLAFSAVYEGQQMLLLLGLAVGTGLLAGSYPALVLSRFEPVEVLRGTGGGQGSARLRKGLVVFQFAISIVLVVGTLVVFDQLTFMRSKGLGFEKENLVVVERAGYLEGQLETFRQELEGLPGVERATTGFSMPGTFFINSMWRPVAPDAERQNLNYSYVGHDYTETLGIEIMAGRGLSRAFVTDSFAVLLNEAAARGFGWTPEEAVGRRLTSGFGEGGSVFMIVGVTDDFHYESLHAEIYPLALFAPLQMQQYVAARIRPDDVSGTLEAIQGTWQEFTDLPFTYSFLADELADQYRAEERLAKVFGLFAGLAILLACLGLFGLAAYTAERRTKEIGIRKVLGASVSSIVALLSKDFLKLVGLAVLVAAPMAYYVMSRWLEDFAYRIELSPWIFVWAGAGAFLIALLTVSYQALQTAMRDPVKALRSE